MEVVSFASGLESIFQDILRGNANDELRVLLRIVRKFLNLYSVHPQ